MSNMGFAGSHQASSMLNAPQSGQFFSNAGPTNLTNNDLTYSNSFNNMSNNEIGCMFFSNQMVEDNYKTGRNNNNQG